MNSDRQTQKEYFKQAYKTGTDIWSENNYTQEILSFARLLPHKGTVLDLGSGRGHFSFLMADLGMKVIGLDYIEDLKNHNNENVKTRGYVGSVAFMAGDVLDIPLQENTVDAVTDFGTFQHIHPKDWEKYEMEVSRVLKPNGVLLLVELSRKTEQFLNFKPNESETGNLDTYGQHYHFFDQKEIQEIFGQGYETIKSKTHTFHEMNNLTYLFTLLKKK